MLKGAEPIFINKNSDIGILMIHGFTSTPNEFKEMSAYFSNKGYTVYAPLIAGHGTEADDLLKTTYVDWMASAEAAYDYLKQYSKKIIIVGNSFGANLGFWLIEKYHNEVLGIVTLDAPIFLKNHFLAMLRLNSYGLFKKYYRKSARVYETDYIDGMDEVTYPIIPIKSLREFLRFIKQETIPHLKSITVPILITHAKADPVIHSNSALYIYDHVSSPIKKIHWFITNSHGFTVEGKRIEVFHTIFNFIEEII